MSALVQVFAGGAAPPEVKTRMTLEIANFLEN